MSTALPRRRVLAALASGGVGARALAMTEIQTFPTVAAATGAIEALGPAARTRSGWPLPQVLHHLAQSVEYSLRGFPQMKSSLFRASAGRLAFTLFDARGRMSHGLDEPIPGAPPLVDTALDTARARLLTALQAFEAHGGALAPHFAYGELDKAAYRRAHLMHIADHWAEVQAA